MKYKTIEVEFVSDLTVSDPRFAQACCEFTCITCGHEIVYSSYQTGRENWECEKCQRVYIIDSVVFNETYDQKFKKGEDSEIIEITLVMTELGNSHHYIINSDD
jgi:NAD-dependent SIR2 family protein deacetylase